RLAQLVAVEDRPHALPAFLEEVQQRPVGLLDAHAVEPVQDPGGAVDAEPALAGPHPEAQQPADVVEVHRAGAPPRLLQLAARPHLALADELLVAQVLLLALEALADAVVAAALGAGERLRRRRARTVDAELAADRVDGLLGHEAEGGELAPG